MANKQEIQLRDGVLGEPRCSVEMGYEGSKCGRKLHPAPDGSDVSPVCLMHTNDSAKHAGELCDAFWAEVETILAACQDGEAHFEAFVFPELDLQEAAISAICHFEDSVFTGNANFHKTRFAQNAYFSRANFLQIAVFWETVFLEEATFARTTFAGASDFSQAIFTKEASFAWSSFVGTAHFFQATFAENAGFLETSFAKSVDFGGTVFAGDVFFYHSVFQEGASFFDTKFAKEANFMGCKLTESATFSNVTFEGDAIFLSTRFDAFGDFFRVTFTHRAAFNGAAFIKSAQFLEATFLSRADFVNTGFTEGAIFANATFKQADFSGAIFTKDANFSQASFLENAFFVKVNFLEHVDFSKATFTQNTDFSEATFNQAAMFLKTRFLGISKWISSRFLDKAEFRGTEFVPQVEGTPGPVFALATFSRPAEIVFDDVDLSRAMFYKRNLSEVCLTSSVRWGRRTGKRGAILFEELVALDQEFAKDLNIDGQRDYGAISQIYQQLKKNYDTRLDYWTANEFHVGEMEMRRMAAPTDGRWKSLQGWLHPRLGLIAWYRYASDYGNSYVKPMIWLLGVLAFFMALFPLPGAGLLQSQTNLRETYGSVWQSGSSVGHNLRREAGLMGKSLLTAIDTATFQKGTEYVPAYPWGRVMSIGETLMTSTLFALFLLAIRRQFRR